MVWFEKIPLEDFDDKKTLLMLQIRATKWSTIQFYRKLCPPKSVEGLFEDMKNSTLIWMNEESFILLNKLPQTVPINATFQRATARVSFGGKVMFVYGKSESVVADCIAQFLCLQDRGGKVVQLGTDRSNSNDPFVPTSFLTPEFIETFTEMNRHRQLKLNESCFLSPKESIALASHHRPMDLNISCQFEDKGNAFVKALSERTTHFGTLRFASSFPMISALMSTVSQIELIMKSNDLKNPQLVLPLTSPAWRVQYDIFGCGYLSNKIEPFNVVPRAVMLTFHHRLPVRFHTNFLQGSGDLRELGMIYSSNDPPSAVQQMELLQAIEANQHLYHLELGCLDILFAFWEKLLTVIGSQSSLRTVIFRVHGQKVPSQVDLDHLATLTSFMRQHIHVDVVLKFDGGKKGLYRKAKAIVEPVRLQNRARVLTHASDHDRSAVLGNALTKWARGSVTKTGILLKENVDVLCSLVDSPDFPF
ncbi:hypothetical protein FisN_2Lh183 [Fistulifera solaris]|uniref:Uncharacterized protein n=1 Tax=Fistulifera solaris TaxID=1519565 RepID=A0A1Z5JAL3_FISSO|nr:hypothetical protein FisN_2Lh183 [Fistulifera solaris]|eukprot:GAX10999.1 hypothetical protein FisN_2Lh183 [Fistulifera solaris]